MQNLSVDMFGLNDRHFCLEILGDDAWLPDSIWVIGEDVQTNRELLVAVPRWPESPWFSTDASEGRRSRCLNESLLLVQPSASESVGGTSPDDEEKGPD